MFISFEGGEGSGKTTQISRLATMFRDADIDVVVTREPGGTVIAEQLRTMVVQGQDEECLPMTEMLLFLAARYEHVQRVIAPALANKAVVLCDRFHDSSCVYQGVARGLGVPFYRQLHRQIMGSLVPDITFLLDIDPREGLMRAASRRDQDTRFESLDMSFHMQLRQGFLDLAQRESSRFVTLDATRSMDDLARDIATITHTRMHHG